ncbi:MAG TPA: hypothetical protein VGC14_02425 [Rhizobium sp.]
MTNWNHDITAAPRDGTHVILAMPNKTTLRSYWCTPKSEPEHWCMLSHKNEPVAWMLWPTHPFETQERPSTNDKASPEAGPQAEASPAGTGTGTLADRDGRRKGEASFGDLPTNHQSDSGALAQAGVAGLSPVKATAPLSDREYVEKIADRVIAERELYAAAAETVAHLGLDDVGGSI